MRNSLRTLLAVLMVTQLAAACGQKLSFPRFGDEAPDAASSVRKQVILTIKEVLTTGYASGSPANCTIVFDVANNTNIDFNGARLSVGPYSFPIVALPRGSEYSRDDFINVPPVSDSCAAVAQALAQDVQNPNVSTCSLSKASAEECASRISISSEIDKKAEADIREAERVAAQQYDAQLAAVFQQAKSQAWLQRGKYQVGLGTALAPANPEAPTSLAAVTDPNFDPSKAGQGAVAGMSPVSFCPPDPNARPARAAPGGSPAGSLPPQPTKDRLVAIQARRDQFGLANWYNFRLLCEGRPSRTIWVKASQIEALMRSGRIAKQDAG